MKRSTGPAQLPFAHLNLRRNPFGEFSEQERSELACVDIASTVRQLTDKNYVVQYIGEKGYGKTTHLLAIRALLPMAGYEQSTSGVGFLRDTPS